MTEVGRDIKAYWTLGDTGLFWNFGLMTSWWPCWNFLRLHGALGHFLPLCFFWKAQTCHVVWRFSQAPRLPSYFLSNKIPSSCLISPWCLLLRGSALTCIFTGTRELYLWEMRMQLVKILLASMCSDSIIHFAFKGKTWKIKQSPKNPLNS